MANWFEIIKSVAENAPTIIKVVKELTGSLKQTTAPTPSEPMPGTVPPPQVNRAPSETVRAVQKLLNQFVKPQPPLKEDGWMGAKTEAAIDQALEMAKPYLAMFGVK